MLRIVILFVAALASISVQEPKSCDEITDGLDWNNPELFGTWYEVHRRPPISLYCIEFDVRMLPDNKTLDITTKRATKLFGPMSITEKSAVTLVPNKLTGYELEFTEFQPVHINLIKVIKEIHLIGCGYTPSNKRNSFGFILSRPDVYNAEDIRVAILNAAPICSNFRDTILGAVNIDQLSCRLGWFGSQSRPFLSGVLAMAVLMINVL